MSGHAARLWIAGGVVTAAVAVVAVVLLADDAPPVITATLRVLDLPVEVVVAGDPVPATDGRNLEAGDTVRTGPGGRAAIEYSDGSVTRLDHDTEFTVVTLGPAAGPRVIESVQVSGNSYHRVAGVYETGSRFDVSTPTATVSVQGTVYAVFVGPDGSITVAVIEGSVGVDASGTTVSVAAGFMVVIGADGSVIGPVPIPEDFGDREWIWFNQCDLDGEDDCPGSWPPTPGFDHLVITPASAEIVAGDAVAFTVTAVAANGAELGDVSAQAVIGGPACAGSVCAPEVAGSHTVTAGYAGSSVAATITVTPGPLAALVVLPRVAAVSAGGSQTFEVEGFDSFGNALGPVDAAWAIAGGSCVGSSCSATVAGDHIVTATTGELAATAVLMVMPGPLAGMTLTPETATVTAGTTQAYAVEGFDAFDNPRDPVAAVITVDGDPCPDGVCRRTLAGSHEVVAVSGTVTASAVLTVYPGPLYAIVIYPRTITVEYPWSVEYTAIGYDRYGNSRGPVAATYEITGSQGGWCEGSWCYPYASGSYTVTGYFGGKSSSATLLATEGGG